MEWKHQTDIRWMQARAKYLNASEIKSLVPFTATGRKRKVTDDDYRRIALAKNRQVQVDDTYSSGAMARGHILEPYAINTFNDQKELIASSLGINPIPTMYHWDDAIIYDEALRVSFSPDGLDIVQPSGLVSIAESSDHLLGATRLIEIKSYNTERHLNAITTNENDLEERWQIATAMAVCPYITQAFLVFYNPSLYQSLIVHHYSRGDLLEELDIVSSIIFKWQIILTKLEAEDSRRGNNPAYMSDAGAVVVSMEPMEAAIQSIEYDRTVRSMDMV